MVPDTEPQTARLELSFGRIAEVRLDLRVTGAGLIAAGILTSVILLSTAALVQVAIREGQRAKRLNRSSR